LTFWAFFQNSEEQKLRFTFLKLKKKILTKICSWFNLSTVRLDYSAVLNEARVILTTRNLSSFLTEAAKKTLPGPSFKLWMYLLHFIYCSELKLTNLRLKTRPKTTYD
jgi:hypothetical protein